MRPTNESFSKGLYAIDGWSLKGFASVTMMRVDTHQDGRWREKIGDL